MQATLFVTALCCILPSSQLDKAPIDVRVGIVAYEDFREEYRQFESIFAEFTRRDPTLRFQLAVGSYGHVIHWLDRQQIDVAILTPGVFAGLLAETPNGLQPRLCQYLATVQLPAAKSHWASAARRTTTFADSYQSVCLVADESPIENIEDLQRLAKAKQLELLLVHPLSVSGRAVPEEALRRTGISLQELPTRFTYSHSQSIRMLHDPEHGAKRLAFVWDDAAGLNERLAEGVRRLAWPQLDEIVIPHDVVVVRNDFTHIKPLRELFLTPAATQLRYRFVHLDNWQQLYGDVRSWLDAGDGAPQAVSGENIALDEMGHLLLQYARSQPTPPRLALVLSGGGAKCSYQVGAVAAIEEKLRQLRRENPRHPIDINLVVGTSGGAINSLPVALGITATEQGREALADTWSGLNQCEIIRPPLIIRIYMGLWFALLQTTIVVALVRWLVKDESRRGWIFAATYTLLAGLELLLGYFASPPWQLLGTNHVLHHLWLWFSFGVKSAAWFLFVIGLSALIWHAIRTRRGGHLQLPRGFKRTVLATGLLGLPLLQIITVVGCEETLSGGQGMEETFAREVPQLINRFLATENQLPLDLKKSRPAREQLAAVSRQVIKRQLLQRDLVITGSCLAQTSDELPSDLYFYAPAQATWDGKPYGNRGLPLIEHPDVLLDVILGSGSIYPVFPARRIDNLPRRGEQVELVDGGFAHNSPVEAAVLWGATHIILIDVMARGGLKRGYFLQNAASSVQHLHRQAQLLDARSRDRVTIFSLSPAPPHLCIIDFASNLLQQSIEWGYRDASISAFGEKPRFERQLGQPHLRTVTP